MKRSAKRLGFTLIEIMLALMVITIGIVSVTGLLTSSIDTSSKAHDDMTVVTFADLVLNYLHAEEFNTILDTGPISITDPYGTMDSLSQDAITTYIGTLEAFRDNIVQEYTVSYRLSIETVGEVKTVTLEVWPGRNTTATPRIFYTELYNWSKS